MVRLTPEHWRVCEQRADGWTYATIALENDLSVDQVKQMLNEITRVLTLQMSSQLTDEGSDAESDGDWMTPGPTT